jgi:CubicO group peptidase (beta-lactamase class C family)
VARRACGDKPWDDICRERLFDPLGTASMTFGLPAEGARIAFTPQLKELPLTLRGNYGGMLGHPGGGCFGCAEDMLKLLNLHLNGGVWRGRRLIGEEAFGEMHRVQYAGEIAAALAAGRHPAHEYWALGWLTRGRTDEHWFGFGNVVSERSFGHAGINTVIGVADPDTGLALAFLTTDSPASDAETIRLRNTVTNLVAAAVA